MDFIKNLLAELLEKMPTLSLPQKNFVHLLDYHPLDAGTS